RPGAIRHDARPCDREAVVVDAGLREVGEVALPAVVVVDRDVARVAIPDAAGRVREGVPDRATTTVFVDGPLDLVRRGRHPETESGGQLGQLGRVGHGSPLNPVTPPGAGAAGRRWRAGRWRQ